MTIGGTPDTIKKGWPEFGGRVPVQDMPEQSSSERAHVLDTDCWCEPTVEYVEPRIKHRKEPTDA